MELPLTRNTRCALPISLTRKDFVGGCGRGLREEIAPVRDKESMTSNGWLWLLRWARAKDVEVFEPLLIELFEEWSSIPARCIIVDLATYRAESSRRRTSVREFPNEFLATIMVRATETKGDRRASDEDRPEEEERRERSPLA